MTARPLLIIGLEAADGRLLRRWAAEGHLPVLSSILERGSWGTLAGPEMVSEHGVWVSLLSGVSRARHGYYYWRPLVPGTYDLRLTDLDSLEVEPFWGRLRGSRKRVAILDPSESRPVPGLPGVQLANWAPHNARYQTCSIPSGLLDDLRERFGSPTYVEEDVDSDAEGDRRILRGLLEQIERKGEICRYLVGGESFDVVAITYFETHSGGHQLLKHARLGEGGRDEQDPELSGGVKAIYRAVDRELGRLLEVLSPEPDVFVISNVGLIEDYPNRVLGEAFCRELGYQVPIEIAKRPESRVARARRWIPAPVRRRISRHLSRDMRERLLANHFRTGTDWGRTTAFPVPSLYTGFLRVNLRGREPQGIVNPGADYHALLDRLTSDLEQLIDPVSDRPAVRSVDRVTDLFGESPHPALPDLFVEWEPTQYLKRRVVHPRAVLLQEDLDYERGSHHSREGFVAAAGPGIARHGDCGLVDVLDLVPTFLTLMNEPVPGEMIGQPLNDWMEEQSVRR